MDEFDVWLKENKGNIGSKKLKKISRKISFSIQLSDPSEYSGGELQFYYESSPEIADKKRGCLTAFPSYILHEVNLFQY